MSKILWSDEQNAIFSFAASGRGSLVVTARAGTGKTTTILEAANHMPEEKILLCAFNKKIAVELQKRLKNPKCEAKTLHSLGFSFVTKNWGRVRVDNYRGAKIAEAIGVPDDLIGIVKKLADIGKQVFPLTKDPSNLMDLAYDFDCIPDDSWSEQGWDTARVARAALTCMERATDRDGCIDFTDMIFLPVRLGWMQRWYNAVIVDEAQDMNACQLILASNVVKKGGRVIVVGDDRQAIYGFRGAFANGIQDMKAKLNASELKLTITYRCPKSVVDLAAEIVPDYRAANTSSDGVIDEITYDKVIESVNVGDFVLSRTNAPLAKTCLTILRSGKRCRIEGKDIGQGLINLVKKVAGKRATNIVDFLSKLTTWCDREVNKALKAERETRAQFVRDQHDTLTELSEDLTNIKELIARLESLFSNSDDNPILSVVCSTVHKAKGLESDRVFILEDSFRRNANRNLEEENIRYVAITRSKNHLTLVNGL